MNETITWLMVEERLPEPGHEWRLVATANGEVCIGIYRATRITKDPPPIWFKPFGYAFSSPVIAWAEMPKGVKCDAEG